MRYKDSIHKVLTLLEAENINPGNLLIGQTVEVKVTDAKKAEFLRPMVVGEFYPDGSVLLKDEMTQETIVLQFQWDSAGVNGLLYTGTSDFGVTYELVINRNLMSNQSITTLKESRRLNEAEDKENDDFESKISLPMGWKRIRDFEVDSTQRHYEKKIGDLFACVDYFIEDDKVYVSVSDGEDPVEDGKSYRSNQISQAFRDAEKLAKENL